MDSNVIYCAQIVGSLIQTKTTERSEYEDELRPYLANMGADLSIVDFLYEQAQKVINIIGKEEDDDDEGELLCDCEFTLAYGTKILLHNTKLRLKKDLNMVY